jgi:integrase
VPLSKPALALLAHMDAMRRGDSDFVFAGRKPEKPISKNVLQNAMKRLRFDDGVPHGLRSTFKDWARETGIQREFGWELVELCLAHDVQGDVERAYGRSDLLHLRRPIMERWADFVTGKKSRRTYPQAHQRRDQLQRA